MIHVRLEDACVLEPHIDTASAVFGSLPRWVATWGGTATPSRMPSS